MFSSTKVSALAAVVFAATSAQAYVGDVTWYNTGLGACGQWNSDNQLVAAVAWRIYDGFPGATPNPNNNPVCQHNAVVNCNGRSVTVKIVDRCAGCNGDDIDLSPTAFQQLAGLDVGRLHGCSWSIL